MDLVFYAPVAIGYLAFATLSEQLWPFTVPRGWVAERRFRKGRAAGVLAGALSLALLPWVTMQPATALAISIPATIIVALAGLRLRQILRRSLTRQALCSAAANKIGPVSVDPDGAAADVRARPVPGRAPQRAPRGQPAGLPSGAPAPAMRSPSRRAAQAFLEVHRPDIVLGDAAAGRKTPDFSDSRWTSKDKFDAVIATEHYDDASQLRFTREHGLHRGELAQWRSVCEQANAQAERYRVERRTLEREYESRIETLRSDLTRNNRALADAVTRLELKERHAEPTS